MARSLCPPNAYSVTRLYRHQPRESPLPLCTTGFPVSPLPPREPGEPGRRAGDTLSGKTGRRTKEGEPGRCVATSSDVGLRLPSAPRTNPMNVPAVVAYLGDCRSATAFHTVCLLPIQLFSVCATVTVLSFAESADNSRASISMTLIKSRRNSILSKMSAECQSDESRS